MLDILLNDGWNYHDTESERLACELEAAADGAVTPALLTSFLDLSTHTIGEHLGDWPRALALGKRVLAGHTPAADTARAWARLYVAAVLAAELTEALQIELSCLSVADDARVAVLGMRFMLADALVGTRRSDEGARLYRSALEVAERITSSPHLDRSIAVASNNLAWTLYEMPPRTANEDALMQRAADASLAFWGRCGDWINEERALYLKSLVANATGAFRAALTFAGTALAIIAANGERPLDAARLCLARAQSLAALGDGEGRARALADADTAAETIASGALKQQFAAERAKVVAAWGG